MSSAVVRKGVLTDWGRFVIEASEKGVSRVIFPDDATSFSDTADVSEVLSAAVEQFENYFLEKPYDFRNLRYDFSEVSPFQERILITLLNLSVKTIAYSELARLSGSPRASRAVGNAMNKNPFPILIPCHRVIRADGDLGQYAWGQDWKTRLLKHEGIYPQAPSFTFGGSGLSAIIAAV
ncbi:MAG TPA: methylated-DNA--[protein]-cysteine S-methyltransferase [Candidatus Omnitrophota bacterium]|nr:methylated-DNA--[protein]-cysteine S-methyltransferase [Candidatus Omnitrophota bacterium]